MNADSEITYAPFQESYGYPLLLLFLLKRFCPVLSAVHEAISNSSSGSCTNNARSAHHATHQKPNPLCGRIANSSQLFTLFPSLTSSLLHRNPFVYSLPDMVTAACLQLRVFGYRPNQHQHEQVATDLFCHECYLARLPSPSITVLLEAAEQQRFARFY
jgi:hypothetical protein